MAPQPSPGSYALLDEVRRSVRELREGAPGEDASQWPREVREVVMAGVDEVIQQLTVYRGQVLLVHRETGLWGSVQDRDYADYRSRTTGTGRGAALGEVQLAQGLDQMPARAAAVDRGELGLEHARTLARLRRGASPQVQTAMDAGGLDELLHHATRDRLTAPSWVRRPERGPHASTPEPRRRTSTPCAAADH